MSDIIYSRGSNKFDNLPEQRSASSFKEFGKAVLRDISARKGETYVCAAVKEGLHTDQVKYPDKDHWRQQSLALPRRFLAFDFDGFETPEVWEQLRQVFPWKVFFYTTASHSAEKPRARAFVELSRDVDHDEGVGLGEAAQAYLETLVTLGKIEFDSSVYRATQPVYTPVEGFVFYLIKGKVLDVDYVLTWYRARNAIAVFTQPITVNAPNAGLNSLLVASAEITAPIPSGQRNVTLLSAAGRYRAQGYTQPKIEELVFRDNEQWCDPPIEEDEALSIAKRYEHQTKVEEYDVDVSSTGVFSLSDGDLLLPTKAPPPRDYVLANSVIKGTVIMVGGLGGTAKTMLVMQVCILSALGQSLGPLNIREGSSLLFLGEESERRKDEALWGPLYRPK